MSEEETKQKIEATLSDDDDGEDVQVFTYKKQ